MISTFAAIALATAAQAEAATASTPTTLPPASSQAWTASDEAINRGLLQAFAQDPRRRVCATYTPTGTNTPRSVCGTLQSWFNQRSEGEVRGRRAPAVLIEEIKERRSRARAEQSRP